MTMYFSSENKGFYSSEMHGDCLPGDAVEISDAEYAGFKSAMDLGHVVDWSGQRPIVRDPRVQTSAELSASVREKRDRLLREVYDPGVMMLLRLQRIAPTEKQLAITSKLAELDIYAQTLQDIPKQAGFPINIEWPEVPSKEL